MATTLQRGLAAGAVGTLALEAATYADMAISGRPASDAPGRTVLALLRRAGATPYDDPSRRAAFGELAGTASGLAIGVLASAARAAGVRVPAVVSAAATGGAAMLVAGLPMRSTGVSDPADWSAADWTRDAVAHLAYGAGVRWALDRLPVTPAVTPRLHSVGRPGAPAGPAAAPGRGRSRLGLLARSLTLGIAAGGRSSLGLAVPLAAGGRPVRSLVAAGLVGGEMVADKLPDAPSRLELPVLSSRCVSGAVGATYLARRDGASAALPAVAGAVGGFAGSIAGAVWRELAQERRGWTWQAALVEDATVLGLARLSLR